ncbi:hypothetical protein GCM10008995_07150 [Halobellus salinus]|uniref:Pyrrolo-quinoline quinone repeat domain-containing protein n=1 Tax=Halobellus salinus TaxID=931585 RepID=A0A830EKI5_9EURY|nr:PQQ-binding-like beta-propeller repeat protein [Halobellus salinus]GGI99861.1 hypothetical protein GCM10008995_07150 [Halobellus salinus]SMP02412.1 PQQ-like domain-containing protein [Halobellus salinus]
MNRRQLLATVGAGVGLGGTSGCLRLTDEGNETTSAPETATTTERQSTGTTAGEGSAGAVTLTENWVGDPGVDFAWTAGGSIYFNDFNGAGRASHGSGVKWEQETTYDGFESNLGADAFAVDEQYVTFGYRPDPEDSDTLGSHFHTFDEATGEKLWAFGAPADGKHNTAAGATTVDGTVVVAASSYGARREQEPLVVGLDAESGEEQWRTETPTLPAGFVTYVGEYAGAVYVGLGYQGVRVLDPDTGSLARVEESWPVSRSFAASRGQIHGDTLFSVQRSGPEDGSSLNAYPLGTNGREWSETFDGTATAGPVVDNSLVTVGTEAGRVYAFDRSTGESVWNIRIDGSVGAIDTSGLRVWVADEETGVTAYDRADGTRLHRSTKPVNGSDIAVSDDVLILGGNGIRGYSIEAE